MLHTLNNQDTKLSHHLLDHIHTAVEKLHQKQDQAQNLADFHNTWQAGNCLIAKTCGIVNIRLQWVPGHIDFTPNKKADAEAKWATSGQSNTNALLPKSLRKSLPHSISALWQYQKAKVQKRWLQQWKALPRYVKQRHINNTTPSKKWPQLVVNLTRAQASLILQLRTGHISLNKHLHHIKCMGSPNCPSCNAVTHKTVICLGCNKDLCSQRSKYKSYGDLRGCDLGVRDCLQVYCG